MATRDPKAKIVSVFEPQTEVIRKGKVGKPNGFGNLVKIQEAENQIVTHYKVFEERPSDSALLTASIERHIEQFGRAPKSGQCKQRQKKRWFKKAQKWRTGCEGRISILKRRHGIRRSRYKGIEGMRRFDAK